MPPAVKAWALAEEWMAEPRGTPVAIETEDVGHTAPVLAREATPAEPVAAGTAAAANSDAGPPAEALEPIPEPPALVAEPQPEPTGAPEPPPGRFANWRRRRAS